MTSLNTAKTILTNPDLKRRYDIELRKQHGDVDKWSSRRWWTRWIASGIMVVAGATIIIAGIVVAPVTFGGSVAFGAPGGALLSAGISGCVAQATDPDKSDTEFWLKDVGVGAAVGAVGGVIGAAGGVQIAKEGMTAAAKIGTAALTGAGASVASHVLSDAADLAITEGALGEHVRGSITNAKSRDEVFCKENGLRLATGAIVGACAGAAFQGVANATSAGSGAEQVVDDAITNGRKVGKELIALGKRALPGLTGTAVRAVGNGAAEVGIEATKHMNNEDNPTLSDALNHGWKQAKPRIAGEMVVGVAMTAVTAVAGGFTQPPKSDIANMDDFDGCPPMEFDTLQPSSATYQSSVKSASSTSGHNSVRAGNSELQSHVPSNASSDATSTSSSLGTQATASSSAHSGRSSQPSSGSASGLDAIPEEPRMYEVDDHVKDDSYQEVNQVHSTNNVKFAANLKTELEWRQHLNNRFPQPLSDDYKLVVLQDGEVRLVGYGTLNAKGDKQFPLGPLGGVSHEALAGADLTSGTPARWGGGLHAPSGQTGTQVRFAGEAKIILQDGKATVVAFNNHSGHYRPNFDDRQCFVQANSSFMSDCQGLFRVKDW
jgi:hypothetical protein